MKITVSENQYDRDITDFNELNFSWENLIDLVASPVISNTKNDAVYMFPFTFNGTKTIKINAEWATCIILDVDHDYRIEQFIEDHKDFRWILYTSFSHTEEEHRFRVIIPIKYKLPFRLFDRRFYREWLANEFPFNDVAMSFFKGFYAPNTKHISTYKYLVNNGALYEIDKEVLLSVKTRCDKVDKVRADIRQRKEKAFKEQPKKKITVEYNKKVSGYLDSPTSPTGQGAISFVALAVAITARDDETLELIKDKMRQDSFSEKEINRAINNIMGG